MAAFESIFDRYQRGIQSFCRHLLGDPEEAADVAQHTFLAAYSAIVSSEKPILLRAWLYTIARNRCYSVLRARREQPSTDMIEPVSEGTAAHVLRREDLRQLLSDMRRLPEDQRTALVLAGVGTLNHQQVADILGVPPAKVKALVFQAREALLAAQTARETDCSEIREQLSTLRGGALRRGNLRRHLRDCQACQEFSDQLEPQRRRVPVLVAPPQAAPIMPPPRALRRPITGGRASEPAPSTVAPAH
jgi:RNA polymerase sigma factor (sigma-70 family)